MIPMWKLKREFQRILLQFGQVRWYVFGSIMKWNYDRTKHKSVEITQGAIDMMPNVAVILIFQPAGILNSLLKTLDHLRENNFAPVVVSNSPISVDDLEVLRRRSFLVMQRPNFGYDFGGYRDAILHLLDKGHHPNNLLVLNDSIWFPLTDDSNYLGQVLQQENDMYGIVLAVRPEAPERTHLQSYMFSFKKRLVENSDFAKFWNSLPITSNKHLAIRRCEMRMTHAFSSKGYSVGSMHHINDVKSALKSLDDKALNRVISYQMQVDTKNARTLRRFLGQEGVSPAWRQAINTLIDAEVLGKYVLVAHPLLLIGKLEMQILKKDKQFMYQVQRSELFSCGYGKNLCDEVRTEMADWDPK